MPPKSNIERILSLVMTLSATRQGFTRRQVFDLIPGYDADNPRSRARQFDRDLEQVADAGITVCTAPDPFEPASVRYRIPSGDQQPLAVTPEERAVLAAALAVWDSSASGSIGGRVRAKLLSMGIEPDVTISGRTDLSTAPALSTLLAAALDHRTVGFDYRGSRDDAARPRRMEPWMVGVVDVIPYVYGFDLDRGAPRLFRISRIANAPRIFRAASAPVPTGLVLESIVHASREHTAGRTARLQIHPFKALPLRDRAGADPAAGEVSVELSGDALHRAVLREHAWVRILEPGDARERIERSLQRIADLHTGDVSLDPAVAEHAPPIRRRAIRALASGSTDVARLAALAAYAEQNPGADAAALADRFGITQADLVRDLNLLMMVGDYSSGVSEFVDTSVDDDEVHVWNAGGLRAPLQLTPLDAAALLLGLDILDQGELALNRTALQSLRERLEALAERGEQLRTPSPALDAAGSGTGPAEQGTGRAAQTAAVITQALEAQQSAVIRYSRPDQADTTVRRIRPMRIDIAHGHLYVTAFCELAQGQRRFRTDRIISAWSADDPTTPALSGAEAGDGGRGTPPGRAAHALLRLGPSALWIADAFHGSRLLDVPGAGEDSVASIRTDAEPALISAVVEADGAAEVLAPESLRHAILRSTLTSQDDQGR